MIAVPLSIFAKSSGNIAEFIMLNFVKVYTYNQSGRREKFGCRWSKKAVDATFC
jgi:hypothetical protein